MPQFPNPYEPPNPIENELGWWARLVAKLRLPRTITRNDLEPALPEFVAGAPMFFDGVVFFVDPSEPTLLHAAIALREKDADLIRRCVAEVQRVLPHFFCEHSPVEEAVSGRTLVVCLIDDYSQLSEVAPRVTVGPIGSLEIGD